MATQSEQSIVLGGGCFWCLDATYRLVRGILKSECGYAGGSTPNPTYEQVSSGQTGHAEVVRLAYDSAVIQVATILDIFWTIHDPTTKDRQGADVGSQYRSIILYANTDDQKIAETSVATAQSVWPAPIVTEVRPLQAFYLAEPEHQDYFNTHPERAYCQIVIDPKLSKLRQSFAHLLKS